MLDRFIQGTVKRISPEAPVPIMQYQSTRDALGGVGHVARNLEALEVPFLLCSVVGNDDTATVIKDLCEDFVHGTSHIMQDSARTTSCKTRYRTGHVQLLRMDHESTHPLSQALKDRIQHIVNQNIETSSGVLLSDYGKGFFCDFSPSLIQTARQHGKKTFVDPKGKDYTPYRGATVITPNWSEFQMFSGCTASHPLDLESEAQRLRKDYDWETLVVTCGDQGIVAFTEEETLYHPAESQDVFDVTGAGDTVIAVLSVLMSAGIPLREALPEANRAAGMVVRKQGTTPITRHELISSHQEETKEHTWSSLCEQVDMWRKRGLRIGFTNGCFDLLHAGHVYLLQEARRLCDRLIVAVNTDTSVKKLKGSQRPIDCEKDRAYRLSALACVDGIFLFEEETPLHIIQAIRPDVLMKGGDYTPQDVVGSEDVLSWGGEVRIIPLQEGKSTTQTLNRMHHIMPT